MSKDYSLPQSSWLTDDYDPNHFDGSIEDIWNVGVELVSGLWNDWTGQTAQQREFEQQEYLQDKMNAYNDPSAQMARMVAAGINPNTAAAGIAGVGNQSVQPPQVNTNAQGVSSAVNSASNALSSFGSMVKDLAEGNAIESKLPKELEKLDADIVATLKSNDFTDEQIEAMRITNKYLEENEIQDLYIKGLQGDNLMQTWKVMQSEYDLNYQLLDKAIKEMEVDDSIIGMNNANKEYLDMLKKRTDMEAQWSKIRVDFWKSHGFDIEANSFDLAFVQALENGKSIKQAAFELARYYGRKSGYVERGVWRERTSKEYEAELNNKVVELTKSAEFQKFLLKYGIEGEAAKHFLDFVFKYLFGTGQSVGLGPFQFSNSNP